MINKIIIGVNGAKSAVFLCCGPLFFFGRNRKKEKEDCVRFHRAYEIIYIFATLRSLGGFWVMKQD